MNYNEELKADMDKTRARMGRAIKAFDEGKKMKRKEFTPEEGLRLKRELAYEIGRAEAQTRARIYQILEDYQYGPWKGDINISLDIQRISD